MGWGGVGSVNCHCQVWSLEGKGGSILTAWKKVVVVYRQAEAALAGNHSNVRAKSTLYLNCPCQVCCQKSWAGRQEWSWDGKSWHGIALLKQSHLTLFRGSYLILMIETSHGKKATQLLWSGRLCVTMRNSGQNWDPSISSAVWTKKQDWYDFGDWRNPLKKTALSCPMLH